jgi:hypothetical protein
LIDETSKKVVNLTAKTAMANQRKIIFPMRLQKLRKSESSILSNNTMAQVPEEIMSAWNKILG